MLGWHITLYKLIDGSVPGKIDSPQGNKLAVWQSGLSGLDWINKLVKERKAIHLGGNGYPFSYTALAKNVLGILTTGIPDVNEIWGHDPWDILTDAWLGKTTINKEEINSCQPEEWLFIEAWDES
jgi:hypothetical protein